MPSRGSVLGTAALGVASALTIWAFWYFVPAQNCPPPSPQSIETLFAPCQAAHLPLAASREPFVTDGRGDPGSR
jgi:hypothetical protein